MSAVKPDKIILISLDTLRADHLGCYGYRKPTSPNLDKLAGEGLMYPYAFSPCPYTVPTHTSFLTGVYPINHGLGFSQRSGSIDVDGTIFLQEVLRERGYATGAFVSAFVLRRQWGLDWGFDEYDDKMTGSEANRPNELIRDGLETTDAALRWMEKNKGGRFFSFIHYFDVHGPYVSPERFNDSFKPDDYGDKPFLLEIVPEGMPGGIPAYQVLGAKKNASGELTGYERDLRRYLAGYDSGVRYQDHVIGRLVEGLKRAGIYDECMMIITADHGEALGEQGVYFFHGLTVTPEQSRVPLIIKHPAGHENWQAMGSPVSTVDIMPTVLDLVGFPKERLELDGVSLLVPEPDRFILSENEWQRAVIWRDYFLVREKDVTFDGFFYYFDSQQLCRGTKLIEYKSGRTLTPDPDGPAGELVRYARELGRTVDPKESLIRARDRAIQEMETERRNKSASRDKATAEKDAAGSALSRAPGSKVDIIIPVHDALDDLKACVESVLEDTAGDYRLVIIDDKSTGPGVKEYLDSLVARGIANLEVKRNAENLGFVRTANRGMKESASDVVLLNSDTVVTRGWLGKMAECAYSDDSIASVTPLTNNGTICSVPEFLEDNPLPEGVSVTGMGELVERVSARSYPRIPTAVGFCMYIKREALEKVGYFDEETFGRGYGEENDWCMRAGEMGYTHAMDDATFIYHKGAMSFKEDNCELKKKNSRLLLEKYPYYDDMVGRFINENPLREIGENIRLQIGLLARVRRSGPIGILHVVHGFPPINRAGVETYVYHLASGQAATGNRVSVFCWTQDGSKPQYSVWDEEQQGIRVRRIVHNFASNGELMGGYLDEGIARSFSAYLDEVRPDVVHFHHLMGLSSSLPGVAREHGSSTVMTLHDFWSICPAVQLLDSRGEICEGPEEGGRCAVVCPWEDPADIAHGGAEGAAAAAAEVPGETGDSAIWRSLKMMTPHPVKWFIKYKILGSPQETAGKPEGAGEGGAISEGMPDASKYRGRLAYNRAMLDGMDLLIVPSDFMRGMYIGFGIDERKIRRVSHGVMKLGLAGIRKTPSKRLRIGYLGTLVRHKGVDVLVKAFAKLPPGSAELYIHGYGDDSFIEELKGLAGAGVHFMGPYKNNELGDILSRIDVAAVPSTCYESFNMVAREALLTGTPVVASSIGALTEAVDDGKNGFLFRAGDPAELAEKLLTLVNEPGTLKKLSEGASRTRVKGMEEHVAEMLGIYAYVIGSRDRQAQEVGL